MAAHGTPDVTSKLKSMSSKNSKADKDTDPEQHSQWRQAGTHQLRSDTKNVSDDLNGTVFLNVGDVEAIGAGAGDEIRVRAKANGKQTVATRKIHNNGCSITLPADKRRDIDIDETDEIEIEIAPAVDRRGGQSEGRTQLDLYDDSNKPEEATKKPSQEGQSNSPTRKTSGPYAVFEDSFTYHRVNGQTERTFCGIDLEDRAHRRGEEPGDFFDFCPDCKVRSGAEVTNEMRVDWLSEKIGFEKSGGPPAYFNKGQLVAIIDYVLENEEQELEDGDGK